MVAKVQVGVSALSYGGDSPWVSRLALNVP